MTDPIKPSFPKAATSGPSQQTAHPDVLTEMSLKGHPQHPDAALNQMAVAVTRPNHLSDEEIEAIVRRHHDALERETGTQPGWDNRTHAYQAAILRFAKRCINEAIAHVR